MRSASSALVAALTSARHSGIVPREFVWITAKHLTTNAEQTFGFWSDLGSVTLDVVNGETGSAVSRTFVGDGALLTIGRIPLRVGLTYKRLSITLSQVHEAVKALVLGTEVRLARIEVHRGLLDATTREIVSAPDSHFLGRINKVKLGKPNANGEGAVTLDCVGVTIELTKKNPAKRSDARQQLRGGDRFYRYVDVAGQWELPWGGKDVNESSSTPTAQQGFWNR